MLNVTSERSDEISQIDLYMIKDRWDSMKTQYNTDNILAWQLLGSHHCSRANPQVNTATHNPFHLYGLWYQRHKAGGERRITIS